MNILIIGGAGYLGTQVVGDFLIKYPDSKIIVYDNCSRGRIEFLSPLIHKYGKRLIIIPSEKADIRDINDFKNVLDEYSPQIVVNLAAILDAFTTNRKGKDLECKIVNYESAVNLAALSKKKDVKTFIQQSSVSIYSKGEELKEDSPKRSLSTYGLMKYKAEKDILKMNSKNFKCCALRSATFVGYTLGFNYQTIINLMCIRSIYNVPFTIFESALYGKKTFLDVKDQSRAIIFAIENIGKMQGEAFNVSSFHTDLKTVLKYLKEEVKHKFEYFIKPEKTINQQVYTINSDKIQNLGFKPNGELRSLIKNTIQNLLRRNNYLKNYQNKKEMEFS